MALQITLAVAVALVLPATAFATIEPSRGGQAALASFNRLDHNRDGGISVAELNTLGKERGADALFRLLDANGNGKISVKELGAQNGALLSRFDAYDANKDGYVTRREFPNFVDPLLVAALDRNRDGVLSMSELRPTFVGAHGARPAEPVPVRRAAARQAPDTRPYCWVPNFGRDDHDTDHRWMMEAPVVWSGCRTH